MADAQAQPIEVTNPAGVMGTIPPEQVDQAVAKGYKLQSHAIMYDPQGNRGLVPKAQMRAAMKAGYQTSPETQFEKDRPGAGDESLLGKAADVVGRQAKGVLSMATAPLTEGYEGYENARDQGKSFLRSAAEGATRSLMASPEMAPAATAVDTATGWERRKEQGYDLPYRMLAPAAAGALGVNLPRMEEAAGRGDTAGVAAEAAVPAGEAMLGEAASQAMKIPAVQRGVETMIAPVSRAIRSPIETFAPRLAVPEAPKALTQAIQPGTNIPRAGESIAIAGPRLQQLRQSGALVGRDGEPIAEFKSPQDLLDGIKAAKGHVWDAIEERLGPVDMARADTSPVGDAMEKSISGRIAKQRPATADAIRERAATYRGDMSLREIEDAIQDANDELRDYYKRPNASDSPIGPQMRATEAEVKTLRGLLDRKVEDLRGAGLAPLKREYGALRDVEKATARANAVATRQKGATLWEGLAALRAAGDFASGNVLSAAKGAGTLAIGRWLAKLRDPNFLIDRAFQGSKAFRPADAIERPPIDVVQGEHTAPIETRPGGPPRADIQPRNLLPGAERPLLTGRVEGEDRPIVTPEPPGAPRLGTKLGNRAEMPRRLLPAAGGLNELEPGRGAMLGPEAPKMLPPASEGARIIDQASREPYVPRGIRTVNGKIVGEGGEARGETAEPEERINEKAAAANANEPRARLAELDRRYADLNERLEKARSYNARKQLIGKLRKLSDDRNALRDRIGLNATEESASSEETYENLPAEARKWVDSYMGELQRMPQSLRQSEMADIDRYGQKGGSIREKLAKRLADEQKKAGEREPGDVPF